jgi:ribosome-associated protein
MEQKELLEKIVSTLENKKGEDIQFIKVTEKTSLTDYFVIANGNSTTQTKALADYVDFEVSKAGRNPNHSEGYGSNEWILLDYGDIIVNVFNKSTRENYSLEKLWGDGEFVTLD